MKKRKKQSLNKIGGPNYVNKDCWLVSTLGYPSLKRCWYCKLRFRVCPFFEFLLISIALIVFTFVIAFFLERKIPRSTLASIFILIPIYGYFFNRNTEAIIESNFAQLQAKKGLEKAKASLEVTVSKRTKELKELTKTLDQKVKKRTSSLQEKIKELEKFQELTVDRELKMVELKKKVKKLEK